MNSSTYKYEDALKTSLDYFEGDQLATIVWLDKYALRDENGDYREKSPDDMHQRLAKEISRIEGLYPNGMTTDEIVELLRNFRYLIPHGSCIRGIGNSNSMASLSDSYVLGDGNGKGSYANALNEDEEQAYLMFRGCSVSHDVSRYMPESDAITPYHKKEISVAKVVNRHLNTLDENECDERQNAMSLSLHVKHLGVDDFLKKSANAYNGRSVKFSIRMDDDFMKCVNNGKTYLQKYPIDAETGIIENEISAGELWRSIVSNAYASSDLNVLFWDTIKRESVSDCYSDSGFASVGVDSYGEIPLSAYEGCRLLSLNLYSYVKNPFEKNAAFDFELLKLHVRKAMRILDDIVDLDLEKIKKTITELSDRVNEDDDLHKEIELWKKKAKKAEQGRRVGLGTTAEGDMLAAVGLTYGTPESIYFSEQVHQTIAQIAYEASVDLAEERGGFPLYNAEKEANNPFINRLKTVNSSLYENMVKKGRRNISCLTIAPAGVVSLMSRTTSGIEPLYSAYFQGVRLLRGYGEKSENDGESFFDESWVFHAKFQEWMKVKGYRCDKSHTFDEIRKIIQDSPYYKATATEVDWMSRVNMLGRIQKWVDQTICMMINIPETATEETMSNIYEEAWKCGCKSISIYRNGADAMKKRNKTAEQTIANVSMPRPRELDADVVRFQNNKEKWIAFVGLMDGKPYEIFTGLADDEDGLLIPKTVESGKIIRNIDDLTGRSRYDFQFSNRRGYKTTIEGLSYKFNPEFWNYAKLISGVLRYGMPIDQVIKLVGGLQLNSETINNWKNGVERALKKYIQNDGEAKGVQCEKCGQQTIRYLQGCMICTNCGYSK